MTTTIKKSTYLLEYYTNHTLNGQPNEQIWFAWIDATDKAEAMKKAKLQLPRFGERITLEEGFVAPLHGVPTHHIKRIY